jgi:hypothetical protein
MMRILFVIVLAFTIQTVASTQAPQGYIFQQNQCVAQELDRIHREYPLEVLRSHKNPSQSNLQEAIAGYQLSMNLVDPETTPMLGQRIKESMASYTKAYAVLALKRIELGIGNAPELAKALRMLDQQHLLD